MDRQYRLTMNSHQASILREALECYSRLKAGQFDMVMQDCFMDRMCGNHDKVTLACDLLKAILLPELHRNASFGVGSKEYPEHTVAWDIVQVVRHRLAWDRLKDQGKEEPEYYGVSFNEPMGFSDQPLPSIEEVHGG